MMCLTNTFSLSKLVVIRLANFRKLEGPLTHVPSSQKISRNPHWWQVWWHKSHLESKKDTFLEPQNEWRKKQQKVNEEEDLGRMIQDTLIPARHINGIFGSKYNLLSNIIVAFNHLDKGIMKKIIKSMIHPRRKF